MRRGHYLSNQIARFRAPRPIETPDTDAAQVYRQQWRKRDGSMVRTFDVLALDDKMAQELGGIRLAERYRQSPVDWQLVSSIVREHSTSSVIAVLSTEDPDETKVREEGFCRLTAGDPNPFEVELS